MPYTIENHNLDGCGCKATRCFAMPPVGEHAYWEAVTDVPCPVDSCEGIIRWAEAGFVPGYRICDQCHRHFLAKGNAAAPKLLRVGNRRGTL